MQLQTKLNQLQEEIISALCGIKEFPEGFLLHIVYVEEEKGLPLSCGSSVYNVYNLTKIFPDGTCMLENPETGIEETRELNEINIDWLITVWSWYCDLSGEQELEAVEIGIAKLLQQMKPIATALVTSLFITDFTVHDTDFIRRTKAETPFIWLVYESGTKLYAANCTQRLCDFLQTLDYHENHSQMDFYLFRYDGEKLFPVFPKITRILTESELIKISTQKKQIKWKKLEF